jgi:hypothetical protein
MTGFSRSEKAIHHMNRILRILICVTLLCCVSFTSGCGTTASTKPADIPDWLNSKPQNERYYYAIGISGPTRRVNDAWDQAAHRARAEMGRTIVTHITSRDLNVATSQSEYTRQIIESLSDTELNYTEVVQRWFDQTGAYGPRNHYYVLVRMEKKQARSLIGKTN